MPVQGLRQGIFPFFKDSMIVFVMFFGTLDRLFQWIAQRRVFSVISTALRTATVSVSLAGAMIAGASYLSVWNSPFDLWTYTLGRYPNMPIARIQMALNEYDSGRVFTAVEQMRNALRECEPDELDRERMNVFLTEWEKEALQKKAPDEPEMPDLLSSSL